MKLLSLTRGDVQKTRGTPLRIKSIQRFLAQRDDVELHTATFNRKLPHSERHIFVQENIWISLSKLIKYTKENSIDVVICHTILSYPAVLSLRLFTSAKIVLEMHGFFEIEKTEFGSLSKFGWVKSKFIFWLAYKACHLVTTCSDTATEILSKYNRNVITIWGGVELDYFNPDKKPRNLLNHDSSIIIGYAGNARKYQGLPFLLDAYKQLKEKDSDYSLAVLCSDKLDKVTYTGVQVVEKLPHEQVAYFLAECDVLVIPRTYSKVNEIAFPSKLLEYMAMGKPVVCSKTSDMHHIIAHNQNGLLFDPEDKTAFIELVLSLKDKEKRKRLGNAAYETARDNYTWEHQIDILIANIKEMLPKTN